MTATTSAEATPTSGGVWHYELQPFGHPSGGRPNSQLDRLGSIGPVANFKARRLPTAMSGLTTHFDTSLCSQLTLHDARPCFGPASSIGAIVSSSRAGYFVLSNGANS